MKTKYKYLLAFMDMAERFARTSEANRLKVACFIIKNGSIISLGIGFISVLLFCISMFSFFMVGTTIGDNNK